MIPKSRQTIHPMMVAACVAFILVCGAGTAAIMGWLPESMGHSNTNTNADVPTTSQVQSEKTNHPADSGRNNYASNRNSGSERATCSNCGVIQSVRAVETRGEGSGVGAVGGAVVGGLLGNQVGGGRGKEAMTVVGAIGGALAGNQIEKRVESTTSYEVTVSMDNGTTRSIRSATQPSWQSGDHVKVVDGVIRSI